jgi:hypothetical protein
MLSMAFSFAVISISPIGDDKYEAKMIDILF